MITYIVYSLVTPSSLISVIWMVKNLLASLIVSSSYQKLIVRLMESKVMFEDIALSGYTLISCNDPVPSRIAGKAHVAPLPT